MERGMSVLVTMRVKADIDQFRRFIATEGTETVHSRDQF
jgi:hypothetical protein